MSRLQQLNPNNYLSSDQISADFENIIRYLNAGERGNKTIPELLSKIFDLDGQIKLGVDFRYTADGLEMRIDDEWRVLVGPDAIRGPAGRDVGEVNLPIIAQRVDYKVASANKSVFDYVHNPTDAIFVFLNGTLLKASEYTTNAVTGEVTLVTPAVMNDVITIYKTRGGGAISTLRQDINVAAPSQVVFGITLPPGDAAFQELVYLNGILLAGNIDYTINTATSTITLLSDPGVAGDTLTFVFLWTGGAISVPGFMLEGVYTHPETGLIRFNTIQLEDAGIPPIKVAGLPQLLSDAAKISFGTSTPISPESSDLWVDTSRNPATLKFYDGVQWLSTAPSNTLPAIRTTDANYIVAVNSSGTSLVYRPLDFSSLIYNTEKGAAGGVATLDNTGRLTASQLPQVRSIDTVSFVNKDATVDETYLIKRLYGEKVRITGVSVKSVSGTATGQLKVAGTLVGPTFAIASAQNDLPFGAVIEIDAVVASKTLEIVITASSSLNTLSATVVMERLN